VSYTVTAEKHITQLRIIKKRSGRRVVVETDEGGSVEVGPEIVVRNGIKTGMAIGDETIERLQREDELLRARERLTGYLALRVKSVADARLYLEKAGFSEAAIASAIENAIERDLLDDRRFAERFVRTKIKTATLGPLRLLGELISHGIEPSLAEEVVRPQFDRTRQIQAAQKLASKRFREKESDDEQDEKRFCDWLRQRGFEDDVAREVAERTARG